MATTEHDMVATAANGDGDRIDPRSETTSAAPDNAKNGALVVAGDAAGDPPEPLGFWARMKKSNRDEYRRQHGEWLTKKRAEDPRIEFRRSFEILPDSRYLLHNRTPYLIRLRHETDPEFGELVLPPFAERVVKGGRLRPFNSQIRVHRQRHEVFLKRHEESVTWIEKLIWFVWAAVIVWITVTVFDIVEHGTVLRREWIVSSGLALFVIGAVLGVALVREVRRKKRAARAATEAGDIAYGVGGAYTDGNETARGAHQFLVFALVVAVGAVLPAIAIVWATDAKEFLQMEDGLSVVSGQESRLVSRIIQITYTVILSLFPALLFFQFDRQRAGSLRARWVQSIFRMDGRMRTLADVHATYGNTMSEAAHNADDSVRGLGGKHSPIVVATILIALGWTTLVLQTESFDFSAATTAEQQADVAREQAARARQAADDSAAAADDNDLDATIAARDSARAARDAAVAAAARTEQELKGSIPDSVISVSDPATEVSDGRAPTEIAAEAESFAAEAEVAAETAQANESQIQSTSFFQLLTPNPSAAGMAFLGAYFFGVYLVLRGYFGGDLRPKVYNQISARLVTVVVVAYLLRALLADPTSTKEGLWIAAFFAGIVPTTVLERLSKIVGAAGSKMAEKLNFENVLSVKRPLIHVDGVDIYESARLESEGVHDVGALATSDLPTVMINTRLPVGRLVDWADQAAMMIVIGQGTGRDLDPRVMGLRSRGIRTGTELLAACEGRSRREVPEVARVLEAAPVADAAGAAEREGSAEEDAVAEPPESVAGSDGDEPDVDFRDLCNAIRRQPVMNQVLQWRSSPLVDIHTSWIELPEMGSAPSPSTSYVGPQTEPPDPSIWRRAPDRPAAPRAAPQAPVTQPT